MATAENVAQMRKLLEVGFAQADLSVVEDVMAPEFVEHQRGLKPGLEGVKETIRTLHTWFSDFELTIEELTYDEDTVWTRNRARGVNTGSIMGHPPTGKPIEIDVIDIARFEHGKIVEHWGVPDQLGMLLQPGLLPRREPVPTS